MKAKVIRENCIGCGACQAIAPNIFEIDEEEK
jgi:ferredoxin